MKTLKEYAQEYVKPAPRTVADLMRVPTNIEIIEKEGKDKNNKSYKYQCIIFNNEEYRIPTTVIQQLQTALKFNPNLEFFKVKKEGTTKDDTKYTVEPVAI